jgi:hypothetical protein
VCFLLLHARLRARRAPGIPCAFYFRGQEILAKLAWTRGEIAGVWLFEIVPVVIVRESGRSSIPEQLR